MASSRAAVGCTGAECEMEGMSISTVHPYIQWSEDLVHDWKRAECPLWVTL